MFLEQYSKGDIPENDYFFQKVHKAPSTPKAEDSNNVSLDLGKAGEVQLQSPTDVLPKSDFQRYFRLNYLMHFKVEPRIIMISNSPCSNVYFSFSGLG